MTFDPSNALTDWSLVLPTKFGGNSAFLRQRDLWMTFELWWGCFKKSLSNLVGPSLYPMQNFSSIRWSTTKCTPRQTNMQTDSIILVVLEHLTQHADRLHYFSGTRAPVGCIYLLKQNLPHLVAIGIPKQLPPGWPPGGYSVQKWL